MPRRRSSRGSRNLIDDCHATRNSRHHGRCVQPRGRRERQRRRRPGLPYRWLYLDQDDCPYSGTFGGKFPGLLDLDYHNSCTQQFIGDVCRYFIDEFKIDGIRFDNTTNFFVPGDDRGLPKLLRDIRQHVSDSNFLAHAGTT